jgi:hypothetical protein
MSSVSPSSISGVIMGGGLFRTSWGKWMSDETWARVEERRQVKQKVLHATTKSQKRKEKL